MYDEQNEGIQTEELPPTLDSNVKLSMPRNTPFISQPEMNFKDVSFLRRGMYKALWVTDLLDVVSLNGILNERQCSHSFHVDIGVVESATRQKGGKLFINDDMPVVRFHGETVYASRLNHTVDGYKRRTMQHLATLFNITYLWSEKEQPSTKAGKDIIKELEPYGFAMSKACKKGVDWVLNVNLYAQPAVTPKLDITSHYILLYLGNCAVATDALLEMDILRIDSFMTCMLPAHNLHKVAVKHTINVMEMLRDQLFEAEVICKIPKSLLKFLIESNDPSSKTPSIGSRVIQLWANKTTSSWQHIVTKFAEQVDAQVSRIINAYYNSCATEDAFQTLLTNPLRTELQNDQMTRLRIVRGHLVKYSFLATFAGGQKAIGKVLHGKCSNENLGEGISELLTFYTDRALQLIRYPNVVQRRLFLSTLTLGKIYIWHSNAKVKFAFNFTAGMRLYFSKYIQNNPKVGPYPHINLAFTGIPKEVKQYHIAQEAIEVLTLGRHMDSLRVTSKQTLRDITDMIVLDFLTNNFDRRDGNIIQSESRILPYDNSHGFRLSGKNGSEPICNRLIERPIIMTPSGTRKNPKEEVPMPQNCDSVPLDQTLCRFSKTIVDLLQSRGTRMAYSVKDALLKETIETPMCGIINAFKIIEGIDARVRYLDYHIDECFSKYGDAIFI